MRSKLRFPILGLLLAAGLFLTACGGGPGDSSAQGSDSSAATPSGESGRFGNQVSTTEAANPSTAASPEKTGETGDPKEPLVIGHGQEVEVLDYVPKGQTTIVDFFSKYCPPCMRISPYLDELDRDRDDITVIRVDINRPGTKGIDWSSPVAKQYRLHSIPHFQIYDPDRQLVAEGRKAYDMVVGFIQGKD